MQGTSGTATQGVGIFHTLIFSGLHMQVPGLQCRSPVGEDTVESFLNLGFKFIPQVHRRLEGEIMCIRWQYYNIRLSDCQTVLMSDCYPVIMAACQRLLCISHLVEVDNDHTQADVVGGGTGHFL